MTSGNNYCMSDEFTTSTVQRREILQTLGGTAGLALLGTSAVTGVAAETDEHDTDPGGHDGAAGLRYQRPELPYAYDALEPHIDARIMELHHGEHHQSYVDGANDALVAFEEMRQAGEFEDVRAAKRDFSFNLSGHVNHTVFWQNMSPNGGGTPEGDLAAALEAQFGSFQAFRDEFTATANEVEGDGWAMLFYEPLADGLVIGQVEDQHELAHQGAVPILTLDVWEHAYYLQYENDREAYVREWWNVVDWDDVGRRYELLTETRAVADDRGDTAQNETHREGARAGEQDEKTRTGEHQGAETRADDHAADGHSDPHE